MLQVSRKFMLAFTLAAVPFLVGGKCAVIWGSDNDDDDDDDDRVVVVTSGTFGDPPVEGLRYVSGASSGTTDENGTFYYEDEQPVQFAIGEILLGEPVPASQEMSPADLVEDDAEEINIRRLLKSLDVTPVDDVIVIPAEVTNAATRDNPDVAAAIEFMDFGDEQAFNNSASQIVSALTSGYDHTAVLPDADAVQPTRGVAQ